MGKKKNKKAKKYYGYDLSNSSKKKSGKKSKGSKTVGYKPPKLKNLKPTLDKKEAKENRKIVMSPVDVPKAFVKNRQKCNHADGRMSVAEFKNMTPSWAAYTPALEGLIKKYGEDKVSICRQCYDALVVREAVTTSSVNDALMTLYAACNVAVSNHRMKDDEVKEIAKLKKIVDDFRPVLETMDKIAAEEKEAATNTNNGNRNLNQAGGAFLQ